MKWWRSRWRWPALAFAALGVVLIAILWPYEPREALEEQVVATLDQEEPALLDPTVEQRAGRILTVLIPYDRTRFFIHQGQPRGFEYDLVKQFEERFNDNRAADSDPLQAIFLPVPFGQLLDLLADGKGDIAAGGLTVTAERAARLPFSQSYMDEVRELIVAGRNADPPQSPSDLAGQRIVVVKNSSYVSHLEALNQTLAQANLDPIEIVQAPASVASEDLLELAHAGAIDLTVVDEHIARLWADILNGLHITDIAIAQGNRIAWALSPDLDPAIAQAIDDFLEEAKRGTLLGNILFSRYFQDTEWIENPLGPEAITEVSRYRPLFSQYAQEVGVDWKLIAAIAFQESGFDPNAQSAAGAIGLMQVLPTTAQELGIADLTTPQNQIAAGTRYFAKLLETIQTDTIDTRQAVNLALAAYNAGPGRLRGLREATETELGLDPNAWFFNVERAAARDVGLETVRYVANVNKYRLAYELGESILLAREQDKQLVE